MRRITRAAMAAALFSTSLTVGVAAPAAFAAPAQAGFTITVTDLQFILRQIRIAEAHATREGGDGLGSVQAPTPLVGTGANDIPDARLPWGLRQVDGRNNNISTGSSRWDGDTYVSTNGKSAWGSADRAFPRMTAAAWRDAELPPEDQPGSWASNYGPSFRPSNILDSGPRLVSNLISDQTSNNPAAVRAAGTTTVDADGSLQILNTAPNAGVAAPTNGMFVLFGQFFDHGLDLVGKTGQETVIVPLRPDDPLYRAGQPNFMMANRTVLDANGDGANTTTPWIDQNQTYTSHPSHQVFHREYVLANGRPVATGNLLDGATAGNIANWSEVKAQARTMLGIELVDTDIFDVPLLLTDEYGRFLRGPNGMPQMVQTDGSVVEGNRSRPISTANAARTGHAFLDDIAHTAVPNAGKVADPDTTTGNRPAAGEYDDELLGRHFITGDGRGNENIGLTAIHTVFHAEHNRLVADIQSVINANSGSFAATDWKLDTGAWNGERLFQAARFVNEMEYQHLVFGEFVRTFQPAIRPFAAYDPTLQPDIVAEFAHAVYRFGHSQLTGTIDRVNANGTSNSSTLLGGFLNPVMFNDGGSAGALNGYQAAGSVARGMTSQIGNEIDEFMTDTLRNSLLGLPLDLGTLNLVRGRDTGTGTLNQVRRSLFQQTSDSALAPYSSWFDFGYAMRNRASLVNFVAAYGTHPTILAETTVAGRRAAADKLVNLRSDSPVDRVEFMTSTSVANGGPNWGPVNGQPVSGVESIDFWIGGLAEARPQFGGLLGSTFDHIFKRQMENLQEGDRFYYLGRLAGLPLLNEMETNFFSEIIMRNTDAEGLPANVFFYPARTFTMNGAAPGDIIVEPDGSWRYDGNQHVVFNGSSVVDGQIAGGGNDTLRGNDGNDRMQGGFGDDLQIGGLGNDVINDTSGLDILMGGDGNDVIASGGTGADALHGGGGNDFMRGGTDATAMTGNRGNDIALGGTAADAVTGDDGSDWMETNSGADSVAGDLISPFGLDLGAPGDDVLIGGSGNDLLDGGGLMDVSVAGVGQDTFIGGFGFDWQTYYDPNPATATTANADLNLFAPLPGDILAGLMDGFDVVEALSGGDLNDILKGDIRTALTTPGVTATDELNQVDIAKIDGLQRLLGAGVTRVRTGNILIGGRGADTLEGRAGDDILDGDAWLDVFLSVPSSAGIAGTIDPTTGRTLVRSAAQLYDAVVNGRLAMADITVVRRIEPGANAGEQDVAVFTGNRADYTISFPSPGIVRVVDGVAGRDGTDTIRNVERLRFLDTTVTVPLASAPRNVTTTSGTTSLTISWTAPSYTGGTSITGYTASVFPSATATTATTTCTATPPTTSCTVSGLTTWQTYHVEVVARTQTTLTGGDAAVTVTGVPTTRVAATPGTPPGAPTNVITSAVNSTTVDVSWVAPANGGSPITGYTVTAWDAVTGGTSRFSCTTTGSLGCSLVGLTPGTLYYVDVVARNLAGAGAASTPRVGVATDSPPTAPRSVQLTVRDASLGVVWQAPTSTGGMPITSYTARAFSTLNGTTPTSSCSVTITTGNEPLTCVIPGLVNGRTYAVDVVAINSKGTGAPSTPRATAAPSGLPSAPGAPVLTPQVGAFGVSWAAPSTTGGSTITGYTATAYTSVDGTVVAGSCTTTGTRNCTISGLANLTTYWVSVVARNVAGSSPASARTQGTTSGFTAPSAPRDVLLTPAAQAMGVSWAVPLNTGGQTITGYTARAYASAAATGTPVATCSTNGTLSCTITGLGLSTTYWVTVVATNATGTSTPSLAVSASTPGASVPGTPTITNLTNGSGRMQITWSAPASNGGAAITAYTAQAWTSLTGGTLAGSCTTDGAGTNCTIRNLNRNTVYFYDVFATNAIGNGPASSPRQSLSTR